MLKNAANLLVHAPLFVLFITIVLGYFIGKFRVKTFVLGGIAGSLIMGVLIGQIGVKISPSIGTIFFALFIYAVGYQGGPQFFRSLNRQTLVQLISATLTCLFGLFCVLVAAWVYHLDRGTAAGLAAGGLTQSAMIGTASAAIAKLNISAEQIKSMQSNVAIGYAVCYIFGSFGPILMLSAIFPAMMKWNLREEAKKLAKRMQGDKPLLEPGQFPAIQQFDTRVFQLTTDSKAIGKTPEDIFESEGHLAIEALIRNDALMDLSSDIALQKDDIVAVTAKIEDFVKHQTLFAKEISKPTLLELTEETRNIILSNKSFDGKTIQELYEDTTRKEHYGLFIRSVTRLGEEIKPEMNVPLKRGDEIGLVGRPSDLNRISTKLGRTISAAKLTDFITFGMGLALGILIGMVTIRVHDVAISIGSGGGCLFTGLIFGWLRSRYPQMGALPTGASNFLRDFGLAIFVSVVGLTAGPQAFTTIKQYGVELFLLGVGVTLIPQILTFYVSYYLLKIKNPIVLLSTIAGGRSANPGFASLLEKAGNSTPVVPFTATYAVANIWLTLWGPIIVALVTKNVT